MLKSCHFLRPVLLSHAALNSDACQWFSAPVAVISSSHYPIKYRNLWSWQIFLPCVTMQHQASVSDSRAGERQGHAKTCKHSPAMRSQWCKAVPMFITCSLSTRSLTKLFFPGTDQRLPSPFCNKFAKQHASNLRPALASVLHTASWQGPADTGLQTRPRILNRFNLV